MIALNRLSSFIKQHALFLPDERVLLAVSAGRDSVVMAHLFKAAGFNFGIAHCNFNMRDEESHLDEQFASDLAAELNVPFFVTTFDTIDYSQQHHISVQMAARDLRYQWLEQIRSDFGFQYISVAHHKNDVMETMLLNLTRGTGIAGMHGILPKKGSVIRPLLFLSRDDIDEIIKSEGFAYREDRSNESVKYARNKIRLEVIPVLKELNPALEETFEANRKRFAELEVLLDKHIKELKKELFIKLADNEYEISLAKLKGIEPLDTILYGLFHPYGFTESVLQDLKRSWDGKPGKVFSSGTYDLNLDRDRIILAKKRSSFSKPIRIEKGETSIDWNDHTFRTEIVPIDSLELRKESTLAQLDASRLSFPLTLRAWKAGDHFYPLGMKGKKKLSDFFIQQKIPLNRKNNIGVLENNNGDIIWIVGLRIDDRYKITTNTKKVFIFEQFT